MSGTDVNLGRRSLRYAIVKFFIGISFYLFYPRIHISGRENIPRQGRLIFAANHQNSLMDPLAILFTNKYQPVFLARADIFRNPFIARILRFFKILPVYRMRDGAGNMQQNEATFNATASVLAEEGCIGIFPEGNHDGRKRLRTLKKGIFRIAFRAGEVCRDEPEIKIVPVGINYSDTSESFGELVVNYGEPLAVDDYRHLFEIHPQAGINTMKEDLSRSLSSLMLDVRDQSNYENDILAIDIGSAAFSRLNGVRGLYRKYLVKRAVSEAFHGYLDKHPEESQELRSKSSRLNDLLKLHRVSPLSALKPPPGNVIPILLGRMALFPVFLAGLSIHIMPVAIIHLVLKKLKDPQFVSSFKFVLGTLLVPLNWFMLSVAAFSLMPAPQGFLVSALLPVSGFCSLAAFRYMVRLRERSRYMEVCRQNPGLKEEISRLISEITDSLEPVFRKTEGIIAGSGHFPGRLRRTVTNNSLNPTKENKSLFFK